MSNEITLQSAFAHREYKVFKNTFLDGAFAELRYDKGAWGGQAWEDAIKLFAKKHFGVEMGDADASATLQFFAPKIATRFRISPDKARVSIGGDGYKSFEDTLKTRLGVLIELMRDVNKVDAIKSVVIGKKNTWTIGMKDDSPNITAPIAYIFDSSPIAKIVRDNSDAISGSVRLSKPLSDDSGALFIDYGYDYSDSPTLKLTLGIEGKYAPQTCIAVTDVLGVAEALNSVVYDAFMGVVSEEVLAIMDKED